MVNKWKLPKVELSSYRAGLDYTESPDPGTGGGGGGVGVPIGSEGYDHNTGSTISR